METVLCDPALQAADATEAELVLRWRVDTLERAGYDSDTARAIAGARYVDLRLAVDLLNRGCPADVARRILL